MTSRRRAAIAALALLAIGWVAWRVTRAPVDDTAAGTLSPAATVGTPPSREAGAVASAERSTLADALNAPSADIHADLRLVAELIDTFRTNFPREGNPVGNNAEITAALTGRNHLRLAIVPPDHPALNAERELCDRWGTPFFFHAESATRMEIRSAGPDRKMWSEDDIAFAP